MSYGRTLYIHSVWTKINSIARLDKIKDIGVYFDAKLDFQYHMHGKNKQDIYDVRLN